MLVLADVVGPAGAILVIVYLALAVASIVGTVKIISKAGYSGWFVLLGLVPLVNIVMFFVFAFSDWPVQKELRRYRQGGYGAGPGGYPVPPWPTQPAGYVPSTPAGYGTGVPQYPPSGWPPPPGGQAPSSGLPSSVVPPTSWSAPAPTPPPPGISSPPGTAPPGDTAAPPWPAPPPSPDPGD